MSIGCYKFEKYFLNIRERQLYVNGSPIELNARYFDALALLLEKNGELVTKEQFFEAVWLGRPVTDEALTQCIKTLRKVLGDHANNPRFIETVPKHGYRFKAPIEKANSKMMSPRPLLTQVVHCSGAGAIGGSLAGFLGGLIYGFPAALQSPQSGMGAISILLVIVTVTMLVAVIGAVGVSAGIGAIENTKLRPLLRCTLGGAFGGLIVGALVKLLGTDAFTLLFGNTPGDITGAAEGLILGSAVGFSFWIGRYKLAAQSLTRILMYAVCVGCIAGIAVSLTGGRLFGDSLVLLTESFPDSQLRITQLEAQLADSQIGSLLQSLMAGLEGALFSACIVGAMIIIVQKKQSKDI